VEITAERVPLGIDLHGSARSDERLEPDIMPVHALKKMEVSTKKLFETYWGDQLAPKLWEDSPSIPSIILSDLLLEVNSPRSMLRIEIKTKIRIIRPVLLTY